MGLATQTFDVLTRIAIGNGSLVYKAVDKESLRQVALKLLTKDDELDHYFDVEALLAAAPQIRQIAGSHVCQLLDAYIDDDGPLLVYEYANGVSGSEFPHKRKLDAAQAVDVAAQLMSALRSGERQRTPHGDLKPSNLIFVDTPEGRPFTFVLDWGLAAFRTELTKDSMPYLAPERLAGGPVSHQADLFSAGALLFYLLTGKVLATGTNEEEVNASWARTKPELLAEMRPDLPGKFVQWMCWLLALDVQKRPGSAVDAATALGMLNPPSAMIPPEAIRPRPLSASQRAQAAGRTSGIFSAGSRVAPAPGSGIAQPATSGSRAGAVAPASASARSGDARQIAAAPKKRSVATLAISLSVAAAVAGTGIWWFKRDSARPNAITAAEVAFARTEPATSQRAPKAEGKKPAEMPVATAAAKVSKKAPEQPLEKPADKMLTAKSPEPGKEKPKAAADKPKPPMPKPKPPVVATVTDAKAPENPIDMVSAPSGSPVVPRPSPLPPPARQAGILVAESFAYADATDLSGQQAGQGWGGAWQGQGAGIRNASLEFTAHPTSGGRLVIPPTKETVSVSRIANSTSQFMAEVKAKPKWYFSALINHTDQSPGIGGEVRVYPLDTGEGSSPIYISVADAGTTLRISMPGAAVPVTLPNMNRPVLLMCRFEATEPKGGKWDVTTSLVVNPKITAAGFRESGAAMTATAKNIAVPAKAGVLIRKGPGGATTEVDEIRYGLHWTEMSFKPAPAAPQQPPKKSPPK